MSNDSPTYHERLWPSPLLMVILLLLVPAVTMIVFPLNPSLAIPIAIAVYLIIAGSLVLMSPTLSIRDNQLLAGNARVPVALLGEVELLDEKSLKRVIGTDADARAYLVVRGHLHRGVKVHLRDASDPTPYWVLTTRRPQELAQAINEAKKADATS